MKIKMKLLLLIATLIVAVFFSIIVFILLQLNITALQHEEAYLEELENVMKQELFDLSSFFLPDVKFKSQLDIYDQTLSLKKDALSNLSHITNIRKLSEAIENSVISIEKLDELQSGSLNKFFNSADRLIETVDLEKYGDFTFKAMDSMQNTQRSEDYSAFILYSNLFYNNTNEMIRVLKTSLAVLKQQYDVISTEINRQIRISYILTGGLILFSFILAMSISLRISRTIVTTINAIEKKVSVMATGDLTGEFNEQVKDEIGALSVNMNIFQNGLRDTINKMKVHSNSSALVKDELIATISETTASAELITSTMQSIHKQMNDLDQNIGLSSGDITQINSLVNTLNNNILDQVSMVEESTASVTEMIASVSSVSKMTDKNRKSVDELLFASEVGGQNVKETNHIVESISSSVNEIHNIVDIINSIASQTNLLAMNAAIEAAHAGNNGKGFSVVADEIRKLAEASALNSKDIAKKLKNIISRIELAEIAGHKSIISFDVINQNVQSFSDALITISSSTSELDMGGKQILEAMMSLNSLSSSIQEKSSNISNKSESMDSSMKNVTKISENVVNSITEINFGFKEVSNAILGLHDSSDRVGRIGKDLDKEINRFITIPEIDNNLEFERG